MGRNLARSEILSFYEVNGVGCARAHIRGLPGLWYMNIYGLGVGTQLFKDFQNWLGLGMPLDQPLSPRFQCLNFLTNIYVNNYHIPKFEVDPLSG